MYEIVPGMVVLGPTEPIPPRKIWIRVTPFIHPLAYPWWSNSTTNILDALMLGAARGKSVVDFGCGPVAILGIAALRLGAASCDFVEIHPELAALAREHLALNGIDAEVVAVTEKHYEFALANLNNPTTLTKVRAITAHGIAIEQGEVPARW